MLVRELLYDPHKSGKRMTIVCFVSGSGTNYREIVKRDPDHDYLVFSNRPECGALTIARQFRHEIVELSHVPFLKEARLKYGPGKVPADCPERMAYEQQAVRLIEAKLKRKPDLICLAGYDLWHTSWFIDRYYPRIINVHPGDTVKGYIGLHWLPTASAIIAGEESLRSTTFIVDHGGDTGPVLAQSAPLHIRTTLKAYETGGQESLTEKLEQIETFIKNKNISTLDEFNSAAGAEIKKYLEEVSRILQDALKEAGDWQIYPFAVHDLIARGRVATEGRQVFVDDRLLPVYGYRIDCGS
jgi:folate-dependent phosphoribosylglycinamide formyltransferase PurN